ncbi:mitochondrial putative cruciform cutting endonuclease 1 [Halenospora varia]|nr:mitochondrial putative cruciform cutting endonuclease 1 [Halenospora varia]
MATIIPSTLKAAQLRQIAYKCGISSSGTKPLLTQRLHDEFALVAQHGTKTKAAKPIRILSIDMGIRNLAYCILDVPTNPKKCGKVELPTIIAWHRLAVSTPPKTSKDALNKSKEKEDFSPPVLSQTAYTLLRSRLLPHNPTHILIERQRFRSMGSKHILEWTIRVNMFESILHAVLCTLEAEGVWSGSVEAIAPGKVGPFWIAEDDDGGVIDGVDGGSKKVRNTKNAKAKNKGAKIDLVRKWLNGREMVRLGNEEVESVGKAYMEKWSRAPGAVKGSKRGEQKDEEKMGKLDDLADSLLQGMAWIQWEENKRLATEKGVEVLLEP